MLYRSESWTAKNNIQKIKVVEMRMLKWMNSNTLTNQNINLSKIASIEVKIKETFLDDLVMYNKGWQTQQ